MSTPPLQWTIDINSAARAPAVFSYEASGEELEALKRYAEVEDLTSFKAELKVTPLGGGKFRLAGKLQANAVQSSVVDLGAVPSCVEESFSVDYWPEHLIEEMGGEAMPLDADPPEVLADGRIPVGSLLCELLAVSIDPYPRNEGDSFEWNPPEPKTSPFAELARFRQKDSRED
jgi:hypothetical protein